LLPRLEGFLWYDPGVPSLTVPYHDTNDFYWSGHIGTCTMYTLVFYHDNFKILTGYGSLLIVVFWIFMTVTRTHYIIDLVTGIIVAHWAFIQGEWLSFFIDVKALGIPH